MVHVKQTLYIGFANIAAYEMSVIEGGSHCNAPSKELLTVMQVPALVAQKRETLYNAAIFSFGYLLRSFALYSHWCLYKIRCFRELDVQDDGWWRHDFV